MNRIKKQESYGTSTVPVFLYLSAKGRAGQTLSFTRQMRERRSVIRLSRKI